jgi:hypothetical protein
MVGVIDTVDIVVLRAATGFKERELGNQAAPFTPLIRSTERLSIKYLDPGRLPAFRPIQAANRSSGAATAIVSMPRAPPLDTPSMVPATSATT